MTIVWPQPEPFGPKTIHSSLCRGVKEAEAESEAEAVYGERAVVRRRGRRCEARRKGGPAQEEADEKAPVTGDVGVSRGRKTLKQKTCGGQLEFPLQP
ncbi:hypothetical protein AAFF_G00049820 [Aldrovandia affinis]|uniref:Uncharacterized protein n=1 Tax=Aldrovandia affinis TaxID=143900 RepID=A0AAD7S1R7_9TELE|nr:hypothetical protein AAFF_G00049820 [Aldrovandia affinis]